MSVRNWNLPPGVDPGTWDYVSSKSIANQYEDYFRDHPMFAIDQGIVHEALGAPIPGAKVADFGCGNGRALFPLVESGFQGVAIDLSMAMLKQVRRQAVARQLEVECLQANLVELEVIPDQSFHHGICLFSTLGMIKGRANRRRALQQFSRTIRQQGRLVLHVHNYWYNLFDPGGPWWLLGNRWQSWWKRDVERGDKHYPYRGLSNMFLHVFTAAEIKADLQAAGWQVQRWLPLRPRSLEPVAANWPASSIRAVGWVIVCENFGGGRSQTAGNAPA